MILAYADMEGKNTPACSSSQAGKDLLLHKAPLKVVEGKVEAALAVQVAAAVVVVAVGLRVGLESHLWSHIIDVA